MGGGPVIGRQRELDAIEAFLADGERPSALILEGPPGIGKTTLWREGVLLAEQAGNRVLASRPAAAEIALSFTGLADLIGDTLPEIADTLPAPQRQALEVALLLAEAGPEPSDTRLLASAVLNAFKALGRQSPIVIAIDDVQWLDSPSASVLRFIGRRLETERVAFLLAQRDDREPELTQALTQGLPYERITRISLAPLSLGALHLLVSERTGNSLSRPALRRLHESANGNPLYGIELASAIKRRGTPLHADEPLPVPASLHDLIRDRLDALPEPVREVLTVVATLIDRRVSTVRRFVADNNLEGALDDAVAAGVLEVCDARLAFTHPLLAVVSAASVGPERRRRLHFQLAGVTSDEERALHLALAAEEPEPSVANEISQAADHAAARGAMEAAARLEEHAMRLTPAVEDGAGARRAVRAAVRYKLAGDLAAARGLLERVVERTPAGACRAEALSELGWINLEEVDLKLAVTFLERALAEADADGLQAQILTRLAILEGIRGRRGCAEEHGRAAIDAAERAGDRQLLAQALTQAAYRRTLRGGGVGTEARRAVELERTLPGFMGAYSPSICLGQVLIYDDQFAEARSLLQAVLERATQAGDEEARAQILFNLADLERRAGNLRTAEPLAREVTELWRQGGNEQEFGSALCLIASLDALAGRIDAGRAAAKNGLEIAERIGDEIFAIHHRGVLGLIALTQGDFAEAGAWLAQATDALVAQEVAELSIYPAIQYEVEALAALGDLERLERHVVWLEQLAERTGRSWTAAVACRGRGLLLAARGDMSAARTSLEHALEAHERSPQPFEKGRTLLALGTIERRAKQKRAARLALDQALEVFAAMPSPPWQARTRAELSRLGLRSAPQHLTETEMRIAQLAATGMSNPEIASAAFVSRKTVEANLTKVYRKLGVRSRVELARQLATSASPR